VVDSPPPEGDACRSAQPADAVRGVEVGNIFKLGASTARRWALFHRPDGQSSRDHGSYGIGSGRLLACVAEEHTTSTACLAVAWHFPGNLLVLVGKAKKKADHFSGAEELYQACKTRD